MAARLTAHTKADNRNGLSELQDVQDVAIQSVTDQTDKSDNNGSVQAEGG